MSNKQIINITILVMIFLIPNYSQAVQYEITDLGVGSAKSINNSNLVVIYDSSTTESYIWDDGTLTQITRDAQFDFLEARDLNENGQVTGWMKNTSTNMYYPFRYTYSTNTTEQLYDLSSNRGIGFGINDDGVIAGWGTITNSRARYWEGSTVYDIGTMPERTYTSAQDINNNGYILGYGYELDYQYLPFIWNGSTKTILDTLSGSLTKGVRINDNNMIVGYSEDSSGDIHAVYWLGDLSIHDLNPASGTVSEATDLDSTGTQIVGYVDSQAAVWIDQVYYDLTSSLVNNTEGWTLTTATSVNDYGMIVGVGLIDNVEHAFLLTPVAIPEPLSIILFMMSILGLYKKFGN